MDGLEDIPFGPQPEEKLPLVVPDLTPIPAVEHSRKCAATTKAGKPCPTPTVKGGDYCMGHSLSFSKEKRAEWREKSAGVKRVRQKFTVSLKGGAQPKTIPEVLLILSRRIDLFIGKFGEVADPAVDETLCDLARTYVQVFKCGSDDAAAGIAAHWTRGMRRQA